MTAIEFYNNIDTRNMSELERDFLWVAVQHYIKNNFKHWNLELSKQPNYDKYSNWAVEVINNNQ